MGMCQKFVSPDVLPRNTRIVTCYIFVWKASGTMIFRQIPKSFLPRSAAGGKTHKAHIDGTGKNKAAAVADRGGGTLQVPWLVADCRRACIMLVARDSFF